MNAYFKINCIGLLFLVSVFTVNCVPTSVLVNTKDAVLNNSKVKRFSSAPASSTTTPRKSAPDLHSPVEFKNEKSIDSSKTGELFEAKANPQKRGINSQLMFGDVLNSMPVGPVGNGVWGDEVDPAIMYSDLQDFDDYPRGTYRTKPYDSLQSILHGEPYPEPVALPLQYPYRYYGDRKKRSNKNLYDMRLKRESKLTPADMLALVALVEAGERAKQEAENEEAANNYPKPYFSPYGTQLDNDEFMNTWIDPATDYYSLPYNGYNLNDLSKYDIMKDQTYPPNHYPDKRFKVAKRKRSLGHFLNEPVAMPSISYDSKLAAPDYLAKSPKRYQQFF